MLLDLVCSELIKYKRSIVPWMMLGGGIVPPIVAILMLLGDKDRGKWSTIALYSFNNMNLLALLLLPVLTGLIFAGEYQENTISVMFTYPIRRLYFYVEKLITVMLSALSVYTIFFVSTVICGAIYTTNLPKPEFLVEFIKLGFIDSCINFALVPLTAMICLMAKSVLASVITGMSYIVIYTVFMASKLAHNIPVCIPEEITRQQYGLRQKEFSGGEIGSMIIITLTVFVIGLLICGVYYSKADVYE